MAKEKDEESLVKCIYNDMVFYVPSDVFSIVLLRTHKDTQQRNMLGIKKAQNCIA